MKDKRTMVTDLKAPFRGFGGGPFRRRKYVLSLLLAFSFTSLNAQEKTSPVELTGYITTMQSVMFDSLSGPFMNENLIHNRLNFKGYINNNITVGAGVRNRLFTGDMVRLGSYYSGLIGVDPGKVDMAWNLIDEQSFLLNTTFDRLWLDVRF